MISMSQSVITGGVFNQTNVYHDQVKAHMKQLEDQVAHSAFHNSAQRIDAPRCHPNTRIVVKDQIYRWIMQKDPHSTKASILWLNGAAGGGKTAIAQSLAERCYDENLLLASFFFSRSDPLRSHAKRLIATIAYQICQVVPPPMQETLFRAIERDPLIWSRDLFTQFRVLVVNPLSALSGHFEDIEAPRLIVIDGLDECVDRAMQRKILELIFRALNEWRVPFLFLVASRPEADIKVVFDRPLLAAILHSISLNDEYLPDVDIELFLRDKFKECCITHPFQRNIPPEWPTDSAIHTLVRKSSGQFIYASVVVKYVTSIRHYPHRRLEVILNIRPTTDSPYAELDALYSQILSNVEDLPTVQRVISFRVLFPRFGVEEIETILHMEDGELPIAMLDMASLVLISPRDNASSCGSLRILHASFEDYLFDASRSELHCVDRAVSYYTYTKALLLSLMTTDVEDSSSMTRSSKIFMSLPDCFSALDLESDISDYLISNFSVSVVYNRVRGARSNTNLKTWLHDSLPSIFRVLDDSQSSSAARIRKHILGDFDDLVAYHLDSHPKTIRLNFNIALISLMRTPNLIPGGAYCEALRLDCDNLDDDEPANILALHSPFLTDVTIPLIAEYLRTPSRSRAYAVTPRTFAQAAIYTLRYLCRHGAPAQMKVPVMSYRLKCMRRMYPWKWRTRPISEEVRGPGITPWMWLHQPLDGTTVLEPHWRDIIYAHHPLEYWATSTYESPVVYYRMRSERYWLALHYLPLFLQAAGNSDTLVEMCGTKVFASKSQDFPKKSRRARAAMQEYLDRMG